ncbi:MFS general substrate transporter [Exidia glandulosa HHB12029]|uniref:MFS general substrate transporter n=1 Tax=Exidia glandulosa HHB12029 TaxID=1314781 RepID=A0A165ZJQ8_EXIGL|nr:MFS general substrate transporter [Exidia glandulosa HHB12029]
MSQPRSLGIARQVTLWCSFLIALSAGTNYGFSAYAPQLGAQLRITHTQLNLIGSAGNMGVYTSGPFWGKLVDSRGPRILFVSAMFLLAIGYFGIRAFYDGVFDFLSPDGMSWFAFTLIVIFSICSGLGGNAGLTAAVNATAKSFPDTLRATATGLVLSGFGLSAFLFSTIAHTVFPGDTSSFLLLLALGTSIPMLVGVLFVRPIPLVPQTQENLDAVNERLLATDVAGEEHLDDAYAPIVVGGVFENVDAEESATPLLASESSSLYDSERASFIDDDEASDNGTVTPKRNDATAHLQFPNAPSTTSIPGGGRSQSRNRRSRTRSKMRGHGQGEHGDVHGKALFRKTEFWILFAIMSLLSGTGLMWINNVGSVAQALYAHAHPLTFDTPAGEEAASKLQATNVSFTSIGNCLGRILIGVLADIGRNRWGVSRPTFLCLVAAAFIASQIFAAHIDDPENLWMASGVLGLAYGGLFGLCPVIIIEWFGLGHFSQNWGFTSLSPFVGGNIFSLAFGRNLDAHAPHPEESLNASLSTLSTLSPPLANVSSLLKGVPIEPQRRSLLYALVTARGGLGNKPDASHQCMDGLLCYVDSLHLTTVACVAAFGLSVWAALRDRRRRLARAQRHTRV